MARYRKKKQKRQDYREGGRVALNAGQSARRQEEEKEIEREAEDKAAADAAAAAQNNTTPPPANTPPPATETTGDGKTYSEEVVNDAEGNPVLIDGKTQPRWVVGDDGNWQPTTAMSDQERTYGRTWNTQTGSFVDPDPGFTQELTPEQELARQQRYERSAADLEKAKAGTLETPQIAQPKMIEEGPASKVVQMAQPTKVGDVTSIVIKKL